MNYIGSKLDNRYIIENLIGVGGMANVYKGYDIKEQRSVAIKILRDEYASNADFIRRLRDESKAISVLNHPNIVKIYDVILNARNPAIVMEYVCGPTLKEFVEEKGRLSINDTIILMIQLLRALKHAHDNGIVHRDIKPQNLMVPGDGTIKVMDFGIARFTIAQSRTVTDTAIGSVHYTSPEQAKADANIDQRTDIYSAGIIMYELLTGILPFDDDSPIKIAMKHIEQMPIAPTKINPNIPKGLEQILLKAIEKDPNNRFQSADEMISALKVIMNDPNHIFNFRKNTKEPIKQSSNEHTGGNAVANSKKKKKKKFRISFLGVLFGITCAFVIGSLIYVGSLVNENNPFEKVPEVEMPNFVGMSYDEIIKDSKYKKFTFELAGEEYNSHYAKGKVYEQYPTAGKNVKEIATIRLRVSKGVRTIPLPDFTNKEGSLTQAKLQEMGITADIINVKSSTVKEGFIVSTEPPAGAEVPVGSTVTLNVSIGNGSEKAVVPDVVKMDIETAKRVIQERGFKVGYVTYKYDSFPINSVISQSPNYPAPMPIGSRIDLVVCSDVDMTQQETDNSVGILCMLPIDIDTAVRLRVEINGQITVQETIVPKDRRTININVPFSPNDATVNVTINDQQYMQYVVRYSQGANIYETLVDNSENFNLN